MEAKLDASGDWAYEGGRALTCTDAEGTAQRLQVKFRTWLGEWYLDQRLGLPFLRDWFRKAPNPRLLYSQLREIALADPGVLSIKRLDFDLDTPTRTFTVSAEFFGRDGEPFPVAFSDVPLRSEQ